MNNKKNAFISLILLLFLSGGSNLFSQKYAFELGEVSPTELEANAYAKDTAAGAVIINEYAYRTISVGEYRPWENAKHPVIANRGFANEHYFGLFGYVIDTEYRRKIKILKRSGLTKATVTLPYINNHAPLREETIKEVEAWSYNLVRGKVEKTALKKEHITTERVNDTVSQLTFTIPDVRVGCVIEYKYKRTAPLYVGLTGWEFRSDIPAINSAYETFYYDAFLVNKELKGPYEIKTYSEKEQPSFTDIRQNVFSGRKAERILYFVQDLPAYKPESYVWCMNDYTPGVCSELLATRFVGYVPFADKWEDVENRIIYETAFEKNNYGAPYFAKEIKALIKPLTSDEEKIKAIYRFVKGKVKWNGVYSLFDNPADAVAKGSGSNAQINAILLRVFYRYRFYAYPVLICPRSSGRIPVSYPTFDRLKTYIVCVQTPDGNKYYLDGSAVYGGPNMLPTDLMALNGRTLAHRFLLSEGQSNGNVDLVYMNDSQITEKIEARFDKDGVLVGQVEKTYANMAAYDFKKEFHESKDSLSFVQKRGKESNFDIRNYSASNHWDMISDKVHESFSFSRKAVNEDGYLKINPLIDTNRLISVQLNRNRMLPLELDCPKSYRITSEIEIPDGYEIAALPKPAKVEMLDKSLMFDYSVTEQNGKILIEYQLDIKEVTMTPSVFDELSIFFSTITEKNCDNIVFQKK